MELEDIKINQLKGVLLEVFNDLFPQMNFPSNPDDIKGEQSAIWYSFISGIPENIIEKYAGEEINEMNKKRFKADLLQFLNKSQESLNVYKRMEKTLADSASIECVSGKWDRFVILTTRDCIIDTISSLLSYADLDEKPNRNISESLLFNLGNSFLIQLRGEKVLKLGNFGEIVVENSQPVFKPSKELLISLEQ